MENFGLTLETATREERTLITEHTYPQWGGAMSWETYLARQLDDDGVLNRNGGLTAWLLTDGEARVEDRPRPILSSCETLRKRAIVRGKDGVVTDGLAYGVASVFTPKEARGHKHAGTMMGMLSEMLARKGALFSILFSDIGKEFYAARGWRAFDSTHFKFPVDAAAEYPLAEGLKNITVDDISELTELDEQLIRKRLAAQSAPSKITAVVIPDQDHILWHLNRSALKSTSVFPSRERATIHGAHLTLPSSKRRVWALWASSIRSATDPSKNDLNILRLVVEDPDAIENEELGAGLEAILGAAQRQARDWMCGSVEMWSPDKRVRRAVEARSALGARFVVRDDDGIMSLNWFGEESADEVDWIESQKFTWC